MKALGSAATLVAGMVLMAGMSGPGWAAGVTADAAQSKADPSMRIAMAIIHKDIAPEDREEAAAATAAAAARSPVGAAEAEAEAGGLSDFIAHPDAEAILRPGIHIETAAASPAGILPTDEAPAETAAIPAEEVWTPSITDPNSPIPVAKPAEFAALPPPVHSIKVLARVDLSEQRLYLYVENQLVDTWPVSTGRGSYGTPTGQWNAQWLSRWHRSRKYNNAPMPFAVFFHGGYAVHATTDTGRLGRPASHGCVRLHPDNAATFFDLVQSYGKESTLVSIVR